MIIETGHALRTCTKCGIAQALDQFHRRGDGYQWWCKSCRRLYDSAYHAATRDVRLQQKRDHKARLLDWMRLLKTQPCVDCGGTFHPAAMSFDHLPGTIKVRDIATLVVRGCTRLAEAELAKCELVCANCHAVRTYLRRLAASSGKSDEEPDLQEEVASYRALN